MNIFKVYYDKDVHSNCHLHDIYNTIMQLFFYSNNIIINYKT